MLTDQRGASDVPGDGVVDGVVRCDAELILQHALRTGANTRPLLGYLHVSTLCGYVDGCRASVKKLAQVEVRIGGVEAPACFQMRKAGTSSIARDLVSAFVASVLSHSSLRGATTHVRTRWNTTRYDTT